VAEKDERAMREKTRGGTLVKPSEKEGGKIWRRQSRRTVAKKAGSPGSKKTEKKKKTRKKIAWGESLNKRLNKTNGEKKE